MQGGDTDTLVPPGARCATDEVYITEELARRPDRPADYAVEKEALLELALRMGEDPEGVLPRFVQLAMKLTGASSAAVSIYEREPDPGQFRCQHLHGQLARFDGGTTPRNDSPCGIALDENRPILAAHPERIYEWLAAQGIVLPEVLLVPLRIGGDEPLGTLWVIGDEAGHFCANDARIMTELAGFVATALRMVATEARLRDALEEQETLAREMSHRVKNVYALTESMIRLTANKAVSPAAMAESLTGRIRAMADAHSLTRRSAGTLDADGSTELAELVEAILKPHCRDDRLCFTLDGPNVDCAPHAANNIALLVHELATNAVKYGALCTEAGHIDVRWRRENDAVVLEWRERGGPPINGTPTNPGFGTKLVRRMVTGQLGGEFEQDWQPNGLLCTVTFAADRLTH